MIVSELIARLQKVDPKARVHMGYDGNYATTEPDEVEQMHSEPERNCLYRVKAGDVVIWCNEL